MFGITAKRGKSEKNGRKRVVDDSTKSHELASLISERWRAHARLPGGFAATQLHNISIITISTLPTLIYYYNIYII